METQDPTDARELLSVLLPTRGRTSVLERSLLSLIETASDPDSIELLLAFDHDDRNSFDYFQEHIAPRIDQAGTSYDCYGFDRLGYIRLNEYVNFLAGKAQGSWLMFWGDDAVMLTPGWEQHVLAVKDFRVLRIPTHNQHPYAIFPIVPRQWYELFGYVSAHQLSDTWVSQIGYMMDIIQNIPVEVIHDRFDITGNNNDDTWRNRPMLEGNIKDPRDFNHPAWRQRRLQDCQRLRDYLAAQSQSTEWFDRVLRGQQDPWERMSSPEYDPNRQVQKLSP